MSTKWYTTENRAPKKNLPPLPKKKPDTGFRWFIRRYVITDFLIGVLSFLGILLVIGAAIYLGVTVFF